MGTLLKNGSLICPEGPIKADLRMDGGKIAEIGPNLPKNGCEELDCEGQIVFPGFIDTHTHFEMNKGLPNETADGWASGTLAALCGGTTTVLDFAEPERGHSLEHRPALMYQFGVASGRITAHQIMKALSENPARLFGMYPQKGALRVGSDGDVTVIDPDKTSRISAAAQHQRVDYTPYEGMEATAVSHVFLGGVLAYSSGKVLGAGRGRYVRRGPAGFWR